MNIWWIRHGPTHAKTMIGWTDLPADLSDTAQLARLAAYLPTDAPILSSDLHRARATADAIGDGRRRLPHRPGLREIHFGAWENLNAAQVEAMDADLSRAFWSTPGPHAPPGGESWDALRARVADDVAHLGTLGHTDLIVVAHFGVILSQIQQALGLSAAEAMGHHVDCLSVTRIRYAPGPCTALEINHHP
ncbi:MAG: histidine phosphatase family protein [Qingshengfaniella sp.]